MILIYFNLDSIILTYSISNLLLFIPITYKKPKNHLELFGDFSVFIVGHTDNSESDGHKYFLRFNHLNFTLM